VAAGDIVGLIGANGAGKSTLMRVLAGVTVPDMGELDIGGKPIALGAFSPHGARKLGIRFVHQELSLCDSLSVAENSYIEQPHGIDLNPLWLAPYRRMAQDSLQAIFPGNGIDAEGDTLEARTPAPETLQDHLRWQLNLTPFSRRDHAIAEVLIESLDDDGYLRESAEALQEALRPEVEATLEEIEAVRHRGQRFDPVGVASRTLSECLDVQLLLLDPDTPGLALARTVVGSHLESLARLRPGWFRPSGVAR
jgi:DNA-directed RNA polymerase specialized sigma54-like protein